MKTVASHHLKTYARLAQACLLAGLLTGAGCERQGIQPPDGQPAEANPDITATGVQPLAQTHTHAIIFDGGTGGYHSYRIPCLVRAKNGTLIAFAEGRKNSNNDYGDIDLVYKTSTNNGQSWSALKVVVSSGTGTWGNPTAVVDQVSGKIWLFMSWNSENHNQQGNEGYDKIDAWGERRVYVTSSADNGNTWAAPQDKTASLLPSSFAWDAMGPGIGIQKKYGSNQNRLIIPAIRRNIYSDDGGATWSYQQIPWGTSEGTIVEESDGTLVRNDRAVSSEWEIYKRRRISRGDIVSNGFSAWTSDNTLLDPQCQGSIFRYTGAPEKSRILFLNPASTERRCKMRIRISYDEGHTWPISRRIHDYMTEEASCDDGRGGYSSVGKTADNMVGALIEVNELVGGSATASHRSIEFHKFNLSWILNGATEP